MVSYLVVCYLDDLDPVGLIGFLGLDDDLIGCFEFFKLVAVVGLCMLRDCTDCGQLNYVV